MPRTRVSTYNFSAGPATIPDAVIERARDELSNYNGTGMSVMELSHRGSDFADILSRAKDTLRGLCDIPETHSIMFVPGGATTQFAAVPLNLLDQEDSKESHPPVYLCTGRWSQKAASEARKYHTNIRVIQSDANGALPDGWWNDDALEHAPYVYFCDNETVDGIEQPFGSISHVLAEAGRDHVPLVADMSSNMCSRPIDVSKYGVVYGGAQKNVGIAGVTILIVRNDLLKRKKPRYAPSMLNWELLQAADSCLNTPPTYPIYLSGLCFEWLLNERGGLEKVDEEAKKKSSRVYQFIDDSTMYVAHVVGECRSRMNIPFRIRDSRGYSEELESEFVHKAAESGLLSLKGHRSIGGLRVSLYNAMGEDGVDALLAFMEQFEKESTSHS